MHPCQSLVRIFAVALTVTVERESRQRFRLEEKRTVIGKRFGKSVGYKGHDDNWFRRRKGLQSQARTNEVRAGPDLAVSECSELLKSEAPPG